VAIAAAQQAGIPINDDGEMVGETDTRGFNVGPTSTGQPAPSSVVTARKKDAKKGKTAKERIRYKLYNIVPYNIVLLLLVVVVVVVVKLKVKIKVLATCYSASYMIRRDQKHFTISEVAADWHELMIPQRTMRPSIARVSEQLDPRSAASRHTTAPISHSRPSPRSL